MGAISTIVSMGVYGVTMAYLRCIVYVLCMVIAGVNYTYAGEKTIPCALLGNHGYRMTMEYYKSYPDIHTFVTVQVPRLTEQLSKEFTNLGYNSPVNSEHYETFNSDLVTGLIETIQGDMVKSDVETLAHMLAELITNSCNTDQCEDEE